MTLSSPRRKRTIAGLLGTLSLCSMLLVAVPAHAASPAPPGMGRIPTNDPTVFAAPAPPAGFDPTGANTTDLKQYGFPLAPDKTRSPEAYQNWVDVMHHAKTEVVPTFTSQPSVKHALSYNWSGAVARDHAPASVWDLPDMPTEAWGSWTVPNVSGSNQRSYSSTWVGVDGYGNGQVEQMGTEQDLAYLCFFTCVQYPVYYPWYELYPDNEQRIGNFPINPGDYVFADVGCGGNIVTFFLVDYTTGQYSSFDTWAKYGCQYVSAEWITERPTINGALPALARFGHTIINGAYFRSYRGYTLPAMTSTFNPLTINMVNGSGSTLAYGYTPSSTEVDSLWVNYS